MQQPSNIDCNVLFAEGWNQIYQDYNPRTAFRHASCDLAAICAFRTTGNLLVFQNWKLIQNNERTTVMYLISVLGDQGI